jgi:nucleotide-binding universal stress UspA family protein
MIKTILVPTDYSKNAHSAAKYALEIAHRTGAKVIFFNTYYVPTYVERVPIDPVAEEELRKDAEQILKVFSEEHTDAKKDINIECIIRTGNAVEKIVAVAKEVSADIIIMGTKGASGVSEIIFGSNTEDVIEKVTVPVLAIPENSTFNGINNIVFATAYHFSDFKAIKELAEIAKLFDAHITIIHISEGEYKLGTEYDIFDSFKAKVKQQISYSKTTFHLIEHKNIYNGLQEFIHTNNTDLLSMTSRKKALYNRLFGRSISKKMAYHTDVPLLVFKISEDDEITQF